MTVRSPATMRAWEVSQPAPIETGPLRYVEKPVPAPAPGELLAQVLACAVCRTDMQVSAADGAGEDLGQQFAWGGCRHGFLHVPQRAGLDRRWLAYLPRPHRCRAAYSHASLLS